MQVILLEPVPALGDRGEVVTVSAGYARNFLLPKQMAAPVSKSAAQQAEARRRRAAKAEAERLEAVRQLAAKLSATSCTITASATEEGHLYGSVTAADIAQHLAKEGFQVDPAMVRLDDHIKELGVFSVPVALEKEVEATVKVWVVQE